MNIRLAAAVLGAGLGLAASSASAQPAPAPTPAPLAIPNPRYTTMVLEVDVARPAAQVWARVGKYCDIADWLRTTCQITAGAGNDLGTVRVLNNGATIEMLVGKTDLSYTYTQPVRSSVPYNAYHGTLEAKPVTATTSKLIYSFFYDTSMVADPTAEAANRRARFGTALQNMKILAEGGTLPPPPPPAPPAR